MTVPRPRRPPAARDPERTRARILAAAMAEFSARGFNGARVDAIARRARINKRMLYHYFGNKDELFRAILRLKMAEKAPVIEHAPTAPEDMLPYHFERACLDSSWVRLLQWEALDRGEHGILLEEERRACFTPALEGLRERQRCGLLPDDLDVEHLLLSFIAMTTVHAAFPQLARLVTGASPESPAFRRRRAEFLRRLPRHLGRAGDRPPKEAPRV